MRRSRLLAIVSFVAVTALALSMAGCSGSKEKPDDPTGGRPEAVTAYDAVQYTRPAAQKWQSVNWMIEVRDGDPDGLSRDGTAKIWEVYYFSPTPEERPLMFVIYNRGNIWPNSPGIQKGGDTGLKTYRKEKPDSFRVDSPEAIEVARRNGGGEYKDSHPEAIASGVLRCRADYIAVGETMPSPKYKWIWDISYREPRAGAEVLHIYIDGMNGDFITKELKKTP